MKFHANVVCTLRATRGLGFRVLKCFYWVGISEGRLESQESKGPLSFLHVKNIISGTPWLWWDYEVFQCSLSLSLITSMHFWSKFKLCTFQAWWHFLCAPSSKAMCSVAHHFIIYSQTSPPAAVGQWRLLIFWGWGALLVSPGAPWETYRNRRNFIELQKKGKCRSLTLL